MGSFLKKNWFICVLVVALAGVSGYYIYDTSKDKLRGKKSNGEDVVYQINDDDVTASEFYDQMYADSGVSALHHAVLRQVVDQAVDTTDEMKTNAASQAQSIISSYASSYGSSYQTTLDSQLKSMGYSGYDDLEQYFIDYNKELQIAGDYAKNHFDELKIRNISYILVAADANSETPGQPSESQQATMDAVPPCVVMFAKKEETWTHILHVMFYRDNVAINTRDGGDFRYDCERLGGHGRYATKDYGDVYSVSLRLEGDTMFIRKPDGEYLTMRNDYFRDAFPVAIWQVFNKPEYKCRGYIHEIFAGTSPYVDAAYKLADRFRTSLK